MRNMGTLDRAVRAALVAAIGAAYLLGIITRPWALGLGVAALVLFATSVAATCPAYLPFGTTTRRRT